MKIYAKQIAPEYQESPLFYGDFPRGVYLYGNEHYNDHGQKAIEKLLDSLGAACDELIAILRGRGRYDSFIDIINDLLPAPEHKKEYSRADRLEWRRLLLNYGARTIRDDDATTAALELITGEEYSAATIRGCCQGDWNGIFYPSEYGDEWLEDFEKEYFNTGDEWILSNDEGEMYNFYTHEWSDCGKRAEIAAAVGADPADVVLYLFDGWKKEPLYLEA